MLAVIGEGVFFNCHPFADQFVWYRLNFLRMILKWINETVPMMTISRKNCEFSIPADFAPTAKPNIINKNRVTIREKSFVAFIAIAHFNILEEQNRQ